MRYYDIVIEPIQQNSTDSYGNVTVIATKKLRFTTHPNGLQAAPDMGALSVNIDAPVSSFDTPNGAAYIEIRGVDIQTISQASNLQGAKITVSAGMGKGLPLAKPQQAGVIFFGSVYQAFGNWTDTNMTLNLLVQPFSEPIDDDNYPKIMWHWQQGQGIKDAITQAMTNAFPKYTCDFSSLSNNLTAGSADVGFYSELQSFASVLNSVSTASASNASSLGIRFYVRGTTFYFYDTSSGKTPKQIQFEDLIGQPTWLGPDGGTIVFQTVMRADITLNDVITMPFFNQPGSKTTAGYGSIAPSSVSVQTPKDRSLFRGNFIITGIRHVGDSRSPSGDGWLTVFNAAKDAS